MYNLYEKIDSMCKSRGLTVAKMCKLAGLTPSVLYDLKSGKKKGLTYSSIQKIASVLNVSTDEFQDTHQLKSSKTESPVDLYEQIDKYRKIKGVKSINQLSKMSGVSYSTIAELKSGRTKSLSIKNAQKLADVFGISVDELYGNEQNASETKKEPPALDSSNERIIKMFKMVDVFPKEALDKLEDYIDLLSAKYN